MSKRPGLRDEEGEASQEVLAGARNKATKATGAAHPKLGLGLWHVFTGTNGLLGELVEQGVLARRPRQKYGD